MSDRRLLAVPLLATLTLAACADGTGPDATSFDAARVEAGLAAIERASSNPVIASFRALGAEVGVAATPPGAVASFGGADRVMGVIRDVAGLAPRDALALVPLIRESALGTTFVYDPSAGKYVPDPGRSGAPSNGVRFVLYEEAGGRPDPAREIGYADLTDEGRAAPGSVALQLRVVAHGVTHLQYLFTLSGSIASATSVVEGFLSDGTERVDFELATTGQLFGRGGTATLNARLAVPSRGFEVVAEATGIAGQADGDGSVSLTVKSAADVIAVSAATQAGRLNATFTVNGRLLATAEGDPRNPVIRGEGGRELTPEEYEALGAIVAFADGVFALFGDLLAPAGVLLLLALGV